MLDVLGHSVYLLDTLSICSMVDVRGGNIEFRNTCLESPAALILDYLCSLCGLYQLR